MADQLTVNDHVQDLRLNANRLEGIVAEVEQAVADDNLDGAAVVLGSQTGKVERFTESWGALQKKLSDEGADPARAVRGE